MQKLRINEERKKQGNSNVEQALSDIAAAGDKLREELKKEDKQEKKISRPPARGGKIDLTQLRIKAMLLFRRLQTALIDFTLYIVSSWTRLLIAAGVLLLTALLLTGVFILIKRWLKLLKLHILCRRSCDFTRPARAIRNSCKGALLLLAIKGMPREGNEELLTYAASLRADIAAEVIPVVKLYYRSEYRSAEPAEADARCAAEHLASLCALLKKRGR